MTPKEIDELIVIANKFKYFVQRIQSNPRPDVCGLCLQEFKPSDGRSMYMKDDIPYETAHHMDCGDLLHAREAHLAISHLLRRAPRKAKKFLEEMEKEYYDWLIRARRVILERIAKEKNQ